MEKLIKLQALIQQIENFALTDSKYKSMFMYHDDTKLEIETYCSNWSIAIYQIFQNTLGIVIYFRSNTVLEVIELQ